MTDNLRTRIAAAIDAQYTTGVSHRTYDDWLNATADAVIRELALTRVTRSQNPPIHRYVTEWETSE